MPTARRRPSCRSRSSATTALACMCTSRSSRTARTCSQANPYLAFSALLMAGLDGVENKIHPGEAASKDLYHLPPEEDAKIPTVCSSLEQALEYLDKGRGFLTKGGVFTDAYLDAYIELKMQEVTRFSMTTHPVEYDMYYSL